MRCLPSTTQNPQSLSFKVQRIRLLNPHPLFPLFPKPSKTNPLPSFFRKLIASSRRVFGSMRPAAGHWFWARKKEDVWRLTLIQGAGVGLQEFSICRPVRCGCRIEGSFS